MNEWAILLTWDDLNSSLVAWLSHGLEPSVRLLGLLGKKYVQTPEYFLVWGPIPGPFL